jgi:hypothetical protein
VRHGSRIRGFARRELIKENDFILVEGDPKAIETFMGAAKLEFAGSERHKGGLTGGALSLTEAIVPDTARINGSSAFQLRLLYGHDVTLLGFPVQGGGSKTVSGMKRSGQVMSSCCLVHPIDWRWQFNGSACFRWKAGPPE